MSLVGSGLVRVYMCSVLCLLPLDTPCVYVPTRSIAFMFVREAGRTLGRTQDGDLETQTCKHSNYPVGLHVRCSCSSSPSPMCLPISIYLLILHPSISLVRDPPRSHSLPTAAQSIEPTSSVHLTALQEIHWIVEKGARLITR